MDWAKWRRKPVVVKVPGDVFESIHTFKCNVNAEKKCLTKTECAGSAEALTTDNGI